MLIIIIILITTPFTFSITRHFDTYFSAKIFEMFIANIPRTNKMLMLLISSILYCIIDILMIKWKNDVINYHINLKYSDAPIAISLLILWLYSIYLGDTVIINDNLESFFSGAIAFQLIVSNIIWSFSDDKFFHKLFKKE